jgi:hypothetical protein
MITDEKDQIVALENRAQKSLKYARVARRVSLADSMKYETIKPRIASSAASFYINISWSGFQN